MDEELAYFARPGELTSAGAQAKVLDGLPRDVERLVSIGHGVLIHEHIAPAYGVQLSDERRAPVHLRPLERLLERIVDDDPRPIDVARDPSERTAGNCRHFTVLLVSILRSQGIPARARCGFGGYFGTDSYEDHWVCEYWHADERRWVLVDAQIDDVQQKMFPIDFDLMDVPRDRFLVAGEAWARCRRGEADPAAFGLKLLGEGGAWWIASNLLRDVAALDKVEMLPWDVWGAMPSPESTIDEELTALFDRLASLTLDDAGLAELRTAYREDDRLRVPATVYNAVLQKDEDL